MIPRPVLAKAAAAFREFVKSETGIDLPARDLSLAVRDGALEVMVRGRLLCDFPLGRGNRDALDLVGDIVRDTGDVTEALVKLRVAELEEAVEAAMTRVRAKCPRDAKEILHRLQVGSADRGYPPVTLRVDGPGTNDFDVPVNVADPKRAVDVAAIVKRLKR